MSRREKSRREKTAITWLMGSLKSKQERKKDRRSANQDRRQKKDRN